jgi:hypothetical protein
MKDTGDILSPAAIYVNEIIPITSARPLQGGKMKIGLDRVLRNIIYSYTENKFLSLSAGA